MIDIRTLIQDYDLRREAEGILGPPKQKNKQTWVWSCPFHSEKTASFHAYEDHYYCYGCQAHGDFLDLQSWAKNVPLAEIIRQNTIQPITPQERERIATREAERAARELEESIQRAQKALEELRKAGAWKQYHDNLTEETRALWEQRGIPTNWQDFWKLGYSASCPTYHQSPSLTIPIFQPGIAEPINVRHRLLKPSSDNPGDKYRPEQAGLPASAFYADPQLSIENAERVIIVEGEIKAAVTLLTVDKPLWQVIGLPGKGAFSVIEGALQGHDGIWLIPDPGGEELWHEKAVSLHARTIVLPAKIDDMINANYLSSENIFGMMDQARRVV